MTEQELLPPQDLDAEQAVLGAALTTEEAALIALGIVGPEDFYRSAHQLICAAMKQVADAGKPVDLLTVSTILRSCGQLEEVGGGEYLTALMNEVPVVAHVGVYASTVREKSVLRGLRKWAEEVGAAALSNPEDIPAFLADTVTGALKHADQSKQLSAAPVAEHLKRHGPTLQAAIEQPFAITPARFGIADLDKATGGMGGMYLVTVTAQEKAGKSTFGVHAAMSTAQRFLLQPEPERVLVFFIEEGPYSWLRLASGWLAGVDTQKLLPGRCPADEKEDLLKRTAEARKLLADYPIVLGDATETTDAIVTAIQVEAQRHKVGLVVVDYLQRLARTKDQYESLMEASRALQRAAEGIQAPLLLLSQVSWNQSTGEPLPYGGRGAAIDSTLWLGLDRDKGEDKVKRDTGRILCYAARSIGEFPPIPYKADFPGGGHYFSIDALHDNSYGTPLDVEHEEAHQDWG